VIDTHQTFVNSPAAAPDSASRIDSEVINDKLAAIVSIESALGANPQGNFGSLAARLQQFLPGGGESPLFFGFTAATDVSIPGTAHNLGTATPLYQTYDGSTPRNAIEAQRVSISQLTYDMALTFLTPQSGAVSLVAPGPQYTTTFTNQTTVTILGTTHALGSADLFVRVYQQQGADNVAVTPTTQINRTTFDVVLTFATPQSGSLILSNFGPRYVTNFTNQTTVTIPGGLHALATPALLFQVYDNTATARQAIRPNTFSVDPSTFDVVMTFVTPQSGRLLLGQASAITGSDFEIRDAGVTDATAVRVFSKDGNLYEQIGSGDLYQVLGKTGGLATSTNSAGDYYINGNAFKPTGTMWINSSDVRLKRSVEPFTEGLAIVTQLVPVWFEWNGLGGIRPNGRHAGFVAQDVEPVCPYMVKRAPGKLRSRDTEMTDILQFDPEAMLPLLVNTIKELHQRITALEAQLATQNGHTEEGSPP
jgi:Chaperone of endosialidase